MKVDSSLQAIGQQCGVDVEALYEKYARVSTKRNSAAASSSSAEDATENCNETAGSSNNDTDKLDRLRVCKKCQGYGLVKETYNHQVKDVNCEECEGEGLIEMQDK